MATHHGAADAGDQSRMPGVRSVVALLVLVDVTVAALGRAFTLPADLAAGGGIALGIGLLAGQARADPPRFVARRARRAAFGWKAMLPWASLVGALVAWELAAFLAEPRRMHPTLSSLLSPLDASPAGRALLAAGWLAYGWYLLTR